MIGVVGAGRGVGVTHLCVLMGNFLTGAWQRRTALIEWNDHSDFERMERICLAGKGRNCEKPYFRVLGVDYFCCGDAKILAECIEKPYDEVIIDFGQLRDEIAAQFRCCQVRMTVLSFSEWQLENADGRKLLQERADAGRIYLAAFGSDWMRREAKRRLGCCVERIPFSADAFSVDRELMRWFETLLRRG